MRSTKGTKIGRVAADYLRRGDLVPDELVFEMLVDAGTRSGSQRWLCAWTDSRGRSARPRRRTPWRKRYEDIELQAVVYLRVGRDELRERLRAGRRREGRTDDDEVAIAHRFEVFETETEPLLEFYARRGILLEINGDQPVEDVFRDITSAVDRLQI